MARARAYASCAYYNKSKRAFDTRHCKRRDQPQNFENHIRAHMCLHAFHSFHFIAACRVSSALPGQGVVAVQMYKGEANALALAVPKIEALRNVKHLCRPGLPRYGVSPPVFLINQHIPFSLVSSLKLCFPILSL